jgi:hypothetical protein
LRIATSELRDTIVVVVVIVAIVSFRAWEIGEDKVCAVSIVHVLTIDPTVSVWRRGHARI